MYSQYIRVKENEGVNMSARVKWVKYRNYAGGKITGRTEVEVPPTRLHLDHAYYLTAMLEAPRYGSVQSYDGAAMSGGPLHNIAVYPRNMRQGSLFPLLRAMELGANRSGAMQSLWAAYAECGWYVARDGKLRDLSTGEMISGKDIREEFTPVAGRVPKAGAKWEQAKGWLQLHHAVFSDPALFETQKEFAVAYLLRTQKSYESKFYQAQGMNPLTLRVWSEQEESDLGFVTVSGKEHRNHLTQMEDLAMCMYHSHSVNGPAPARTVLKKVLKKATRGEGFARALVWALGTRKYGRWADTLDGRNRYDRTRYHARRSGLWPSRFFKGPEALMPKDLSPRAPRVS